MPFPRRQGRQPLQNLAFLVRHGYLAVIPHIKTAGHIANVSVDGGRRVLIRYGTHHFLLSALLGYVRRSKEGVAREWRDIFSSSTGL